jgi:hypothetical protein
VRREPPKPISLCFQRASWIPVALARAILLLQIPRPLDPSRTPSARPSASNVLRGLADTQRSPITAGICAETLALRWMARGPKLALGVRLLGDVRLAFGDADELSSKALLLSLVESTTNVVVGFLLALSTQVAIFPLFGITVSVGDNLLIGGIFTVVSIVRSFTLRRLFEAVRVRQARAQTPRADLSL